MSTVRAGTPVDRQPIERFDGQYRFLSNFWSVTVTLDGIRYPSVEHAYQAAKTVDYDERNRVFRCRTPGAAKRAGRAVTLRADWERVKVQVMYELLVQKFSRASLGYRLLETGNRELVEGNEWGDRYWGVFRGSGLNMLGKLLMKVRGELRGDVTTKR